MLLKVVVVVLHSPSKTIKCWSCTQQTTPLLFCESCQSILDYPVDLSLSHFDIFKITEHLLIDETELRTKFYHLSKQVHPDRFTMAVHPAPLYALRWSTALNRAYQTLKNPQDRTHLVIERYIGHSDALAKAAIPTDLAESYFEIQDLLSEGQVEPILNFNKELESLLMESQKMWHKLAAEFDSGFNKTKSAEDLRTHANREKYLRSMLLDIERKVNS